MRTLIFGSVFLSHIWFQVKDCPKKSFALDTFVHIYSISKMFDLLKDCNVRTVQCRYMNESFTSWSSARYRMVCFPALLPRHGAEQLNPAPVLYSHTALLS